jgi:hypothetical protein
LAPFSEGVSSLVSELSEDDLANYLVWRLIVTFYPSKYSDETRRRETCLKQTEEVFGPVSVR